MNLDLVRAIPTQYMLLGMAALVAASMGFGYIKGAHHEALKAARFEAATEALGKAAQTAKAAHEKQDKLNKEKTDAETKRSLERLRADNQRLRDERARIRFVPETASAAGSPDRACFNRPGLESAIRVFTDEVQGIVEQCGEAVIKLDAVKIWAQRRGD